MYIDLDPDILMALQGGLFRIILLHFATHVGFGKEKCLGTSTQEACYLCEGGRRTLKFSLTKDPCHLIT